MLDPQGSDEHPNPDDYSKGRFMTIMGSFFDSKQEIAKYKEELDKAKKNVEISERMTGVLRKMNNDLHAQLKIVTEERDALLKKRDVVPKRAEKYKRKWKEVSTELKHQRDVTEAIQRENAFFYHTMVGHMRASSGRINTIISQHKKFRLNPSSVVSIPETLEPLPPPPKIIAVEEKKKGKEEVDQAAIQLLQNLSGSEGESTEEEGKGKKEGEEEGKRKEEEEEPLKEVEIKKRYDTRGKKFHRPGRFHRKALPSKITEQQWDKEKVRKALSSIGWPAHTFRTTEPTVGYNAINCMFYRHGFSGVERDNRWLEFLKAIQE
jgi:hypothetical protein